MAEIVAALLIVGVGSHLAIQAAPQYWHRGEKERRESALRRIASFSHANQDSALASGKAEPAPWRSSDYRQYFVPIGLRLDHARRVVREAQDASSKDVSA